MGSQDPPVLVRKAQGGAEGLPRLEQRASVERATVYAGPGAPDGSMAPGALAKSLYRKLAAAVSFPETVRWSAAHDGA
jgi:hypothetical protein